MAVKIIVCPWCGKEARITYEENRVYQMKCYACHNSMLHEDKSFDRAVEFFEHHAKLLQADQAGQLVVLPFPQNKSLLDMSNPENPELLVNFRVAIAYSHCGIVFHQPFNIFMENVERGYICQVSEEAETALAEKGGSNEADSV